MASRFALFRYSTSSSSSNFIRSFASTSNPSHNNDHRNNHKFLEPNTFLGSWQSPKDPKEAEAKLRMLRRDYAKQVKEFRKQYICEMELLQLEKQRKDDARREALRVANVERKKLKAEAAQIRAQERKIAQQEFRETLMTGYRSLPPKAKNLVVAGALTAFVFGGYFYTMRAVGGTDELQVAIDKFESEKSKPEGNASMP